MSVIIHRERVSNNKGRQGAFLEHIIHRDAYIMQKEALLSVSFPGFRPSESPWKESGHQMFGMLVHVWAMPLGCGCYVDIRSFESCGVLSRCSLWPRRKTCKRNSFAKISFFLLWKASRRRRLLGCSRAAGSHCRVRRIHLLAAFFHMIVEG